MSEPTVFGYSNRKWTKTVGESKTKISDWLHEKGRQAICVEFPTICVDFPTICVGFPFWDLLIDFTTSLGESVRSRGRGDFFLYTES